MARLKCLVIFSLLVLGVACSSSSAVNPAGADQITTAEDKLNRGALLLDVRTPEEYQHGHVSGALNIPVEELPHRIHELGENRLQAIVVYSKSGKRANVALNTLYELGFENVLNAGSYESLNQRIKRN